MRVFLLFDCVPFVRCVYEFSEGWKEVLGTTFRSRSEAPSERVVSSLFGCGPFRGRRLPKFRFGLLLSFDSSRTSTGDGCLFLLEPRASDLKALKTEK